MKQTSDTASYKFPCTASSDQEIEFNNKIQSEPSNLSSNNQEQTTMGPPKRNIKPLATVDPSPIARGRQTNRERDHELVRVLFFNNYLR